MERLSSSVINRSLHNVYSKGALEKLKLYYGYTLELVKSFECVNKMEGTYSSQSIAEKESDLMVLLVNH